MKSSQHALQRASTVQPRRGGGVVVAYPGAVITAALKTTLRLTRGEKRAQPHGTQRMKAEGWRGGGVEEEIENTREGREGALAQCGGSPDGRVGLNGCVRERLQQRGVRVVRTEGRSVSSVCKCVCLCTACVCASVCAGGDGFVMKTAGSQRSRAPLCG